MFKSNKPTFASAMGLFTKAQDELKAAKEQNDIDLKESEAAWTVAKTEGQNIDRVATFFANLLDGKTA